MSLMFATPRLIANRLVLLTAAMSVMTTASASVAGQDAAGPGAPRHFFPPWEGAGVYVFGPVRIDLNRMQEGYVPLATNALRDCSNAEIFCLTARRARGRGGVIHFAGPRSCTDMRVGDSWSAEGVRTEVLAVKVDPERTLSAHGGRPQTIYYLGSADNPGIVYEYWRGEGVVALYLGLTSHRDLVAAVRAGLDPRDLPAQHRSSLLTFDRFAPCRFSLSAP